MHGFSFHGSRWALGLLAALVVCAEPGAARAQSNAAATENDALRRRVETLERELAHLKRQLEAVLPSSSGVSQPIEPAAPSPADVPSEGFERDFEPRSAAGSVILSGEFGFAYFDGEAETPFSDGQFRIDDAKLFLEAEVRRGVYTFFELDVALREGDQRFQLGELYLELEDVGALFGGAELGTLRIGRLDIPFGEEYLHRDPLQNPLISHSLADFWGVDEGVELFGVRGPWSYVLAVQNGSRPPNADFTSDKAITVRLGWDPTERFHVGLSGMRTGKMDPVNERITELWWGGGFLRSIGNPTTTEYFSADLVQADATVRWPKGHLKGAGGVVWYDDEDRLRDNRRTMTHFMVEGLHQMSRDVYLAARYSVIDAGDGYPIAGQGEIGKYFFGPFLAEDVWRLSMGLGYRWSTDVLLKFEYSLEGGSFVGGADREAMNQLATQAAVRF